MKSVFLNGQIVPGESATVSIFDRAFLYGDGLFETLRVSKGQPHLWDEHFTRFSAGAKVLGIALDYDATGLRKEVYKLLDANGSTDAVLRIQLFSCTSNGVLFSASSFSFSAFLISIR